LHDDNDDNDGFDEDHKNAKDAHIHNTEQIEQTSQGGQNQDVSKRTNARHAIATPSSDPTASAPPTLTPSHQKRPRETITQPAENTESKAVPPPPRMSALEARRAKYLNRTKDQNETTHKSRMSSGSRKPSKQREEETMSKLNQFKSKMFQAKGRKHHRQDRDRKLQDERHTRSSDYAIGNTNGSGEGENGETLHSRRDDSLASRMARKEDGKNGRKRSNRHRDHASVPVYSGQILEDAEGSSVKARLDASENDSERWMEPTFKCKRHIDHDSKGAAISSGGGSGDGRNMDDYEVIDSRRKRSRKN